MIQGMTCEAEENHVSLHAIADGVLEALCGSGINAHKKVDTLPITIEIFHSLAVYVVSGRVLNGKRLWNYSHHTYMRFQSDRVYTVDFGTKFEYANPNFPQNLVDLIIKKQKEAREKHDILMQNPNGFLQT